MSTKLVQTLLATGASLAAAGIGVVFAANREIRHFELKQVTAPVLEPGTFEDPETEAFTILHISDLHMLDRQKLKQAWVAGLESYDFDIVINTGDNLGEDKGVPGVLRALDPLMHHPGAFVFGSNDYFAPRPVNPFIYLLGKKRNPSRVELPWRGMRAAFIERGWNDATHRHVEFSVEPREDATFPRHRKFNLDIAGVDDPHHELNDFSQIAGGPNPDADLAIGLTHSPEPEVLDQFAAEGYQLVLSGHTHGGQLCLPGSRAIVTNCGLDRSRVQGLSRWSERLWLHVSNGLGNSKYVPFRTFCRPSATLIHVVERDQADPREQ